MSFSSDSGDRKDRLISEPVAPAAGSFDAAAMASGVPGVPAAFAWRGREYRVARILETGKSLRSCRNGSGERYINKHYYRVETESGETMTLYRTRSGSKRDSWILYTLRDAQGEHAMRIAVLVSGGGTNLQALIDAAAAGNGTADGRFEIVLVVADRDCYALERARKHSIPARLVTAPAGTPRAEARRIVSDGVLALAREYRADALVLAGFLTIMGGPVIAEYSNRIVNLHPALLPKFGGAGDVGAPRARGGPCLG